VLQRVASWRARIDSQRMRCVAACCSVLQLVAVCCSVLRLGGRDLIARECGVLQCVAACCSLL